MRDEGFGNWRLEVRVKNEEWRVRIKESGVSRFRGGYHHYFYYFYYIYYFYYNHQYVVLSWERGSIHQRMLIAENGSEFGSELSQK